MRNLVVGLGGAVVATVLFVGNANAILVAGNGQGEFSSLSTQGSGFAEIVDTANGDNTRVRWGRGGGTSRLTAIDTTFSTNVPPDQSGVVVGALKWFNAASNANRTPDVLRFDYDFTLTFTSPVGQSDTANFRLRVRNTDNPQGDITRGLQLTPLSDLSFTLPGIDIANIKFSLAPSSTSTFDPSKGKWFNEERKTSVLNIVADFSATAVPEPATLGLLGLGLVGLGFATRERRQTA